MGFRIWFQIYKFQIVSVFNGRKLKLGSFTIQPLIYFNSPLNTTNYNFTINDQMPILFPESNHSFNVRNILIIYYENKTELMLTLLGTDILSLNTNCNYLRNERQFNENEDTN